jgi:hypothetical protein
MGGRVEGVDLLGWKKSITKVEVEEKNTSALLRNGLLGSRIKRRQTAVGSLKSRAVVEQGVAAEAKRGKRAAGVVLKEGRWSRKLTGVGSSHS